jgi:hypothetical protein
MKTLQEYRCVDQAICSRMIALSIPEKLKLIDKVLLSGQKYTRLTVLLAINKTFPEELPMCHEEDSKIARSVLLLERWIINNHLN